MQVAVTAGLFGFMVAVSPALHAQKAAAGPYHDPQYKFLAQPPPGSHVFYTALAGGDVGFEAHMGPDTYWVHAEGAPSDDMNAFLDKQQQVIRKLCSGDPVFTQSPTTLAGQPAVELKASCSPSDDNAIDKRAFTVAILMHQSDEQGLVVYTVGMMTSPKRAAKTQPVYQAMLDSFKLE